MASLELHAPGKINLGLRLVGRREDGYHELESLFLPLELADAVVIDVQPGRRGILELTVEGGHASVPAGEENLAWKAASSFLRASGLEANLRLRLRKTIPVGAGLGGGSSDAAAVLRGLSRLHPGRVPDLRALALELGADVPFFLDPRPARVGGIGERIEPVEGLPALPVVLLAPRMALSTAAVYAAWDASGAALTPRSAASTMPWLLPLRRLRGDPGRIAIDISVEEWAEALRNDLEPAAVLLCPPVAGLSRRMREVGSVAVGMSGSGPTVFGVFGSGPEAEEAERVLSAGGCERVIRTRTIGSP